MSHSHPTPTFLRAFGLGLTLTMIFPALALAQGDSAPAGGAETAQVVGATAVAMLMTIALFIFGLGHRSGRVKLLGRVAAFASKGTGLVTWAALPVAIATVSLITAAFGFYWDVSLHIDNGRDPGPLANPSHYFILFGLFGIFSAGWIAMVLPTDKPGPAAVRITRDWQVPVGGIMLMASAAFALAGFPLDDVSHRFFGQDVTLWGPTHLMMLGGAALSLIGIMTLIAESRAAADSSTESESFDILGLVKLSPKLSRWIRLVLAAGGLLIALSIFQAEFDYGVPQFRLLFHPLLIAFAATAALVAVRTIVGPGAAVGAAVFYIVVRGIITLIVGPIFGETVASFPPYIVEALLVEAIALALGTRRTYRFALISALAIGTIGVAAEWVWSQIWMPIPWPAHILGDAILVGLAAAIAGGVLGAFLAGAIERRPEISATPRSWAAAGASVLVIVALFAYLLQVQAPQGVVASVQTEELSDNPRTIAATVTVDPASAVARPDWLMALSWQGGEPLVAQHLEQVEPGVYRTTEPIPVDGSWKSMLRLHSGTTMATAPVFLPEDAAIPAAEIPAPSSFERPFESELQFLQREVKDDVPGWLFAAAGIVVGAVTLLVLLLTGWGLARLAATGRPTPGGASVAAELDRGRSSSRPAQPLPSA